MRLTTDDMILEYYERVKHLYPGVSYEQFKPACTTQFLMLKREMESGDLKTVRIKGLGTFLVYPNRVKAILERIKNQFHNLIITKERYFSKKAMMEKYLERHGDDTSTKAKTGIPRISKL